MERKVPAGGTTLEGHYLPEGTLVGVNAWALHYDKSIFGQDTDCYRPERWLEASDEKKLEMKKHIFTVCDSKPGILITAATCMTLWIPSLHNFHFPSMDQQVAPVVL